MIKKTRAIFSLLLCLNIFAISFYGSVINISDSFHVMTTHQAAIDHHHHDSFSLHIDHDDSSMVHQHTVDYFQNLAVLCNNKLLLTLINLSRVRSASFELPPSAFIDGPFRPPQSPA